MLLASTRPANASARTFPANTAFFRRGRQRRFRHVMNGTYQSYQANLFDYSHTASGGESASTHAQTVAAFRQDHALPLFELRPEGFLDRIAEAFVHRDIDFESIRNFQGAASCAADGSAIRVMFTPALLRFFEMVPPERKWHIEGGGFMLLAYRANVTVAPQEIRTFLDETCSIANSFFAACGRSRQSRNAQVPTPLCESPPPPLPMPETALGTSHPRHRNARDATVLRGRNDLGKPLPALQ